MARDDEECQQGLQYVERGDRRAVAGCLSVDREDIVIAKL